jgi:hypothetical protein
MIETQSGRSDPNKDDLDLNADDPDPDIDEPDKHRRLDLNIDESDLTI